MLCLLAAAIIIRLRLFDSLDLPISALRIEPRSIEIYHILTDDRRTFVFPLKPQPHIMRRDPSRVAVQDSGIHGPVLQAVIAL